MDSRKILSNFENFIISLEILLSENFWEKSLSFIKVLQGEKMREILSELDYVNL